MKMRNCVGWTGLGQLGPGVLGLGVLGLGAPGCDAQADPTYRGEPLITIDGRVESALSVGDVEVGVLWFVPTSSQIDAQPACNVLLSGETPSACVAACGVPSCDSIAALEAWLECSSPCDGPDGVTSISIEAYGGQLFSGAVGQTTPVQGEFPAQFSLDILEPPPPEVLSGSSTGEQLAFGLFVALDPAGAPFELDLADLPNYPPWVLGGSGSHLLVYTPGGVPRDSEQGTLFELELEPGFQLMEITRVESVNEDGERVESDELVPVADTATTEVRLVVADPATIDWPINDL